MKTSLQTLAVLALLGAGALPAAAADKLCKLQIAGNDLMQFDQKALKVAADCTQVELTLKHTGKLPMQAMGHDWVLVNTADVNEVTASGIAAGAAKGYLDAADKRIIAHTKMIGGGESASVTFPTSLLRKGGDYTYVCTFPGHSALMKGKLTFG